jgi:hypothetical protein
MWRCVTSSGHPSCTWPNSFFLNLKIGKDLNFLYMTLMSKRIYLKFNEILIKSLIRIRARYDRDRRKAAEMRTKKKLDWIYTVKYKRKKYKSVLRLKFRAQAFIQRNNFTRFLDICRVCTDPNSASDSHERHVIKRWRNILYYFTWITTLCKICLLVFDSRRGLGIFLFTTAFRTALEPTQPPIQCVPGALSLGVKRPGRAADHSSPSRAGDKNAWSYTSTPQHVFMA